MNKATRTAKRIQAASEDKLLDGLRATQDQLSKATKTLSNRKLDRLQRRIKGYERSRKEREAREPVNYSLTDLGLDIAEQFEEACRPFVVDSQGTVTR